MEYMNELAKPFYFDGKKEIGILMIHGFTGTPAKIRPLGEHLHRETGFTVSGILLHGHGTSVEDMMTSNVEDWISDALNGYDELKKECETVYVVGFSMGGMLSLKVTQEREVAKLVTIEAAYRDRNPITRLAFIIKHFMPYVYWDEMDPALEKDYLMDYNIGYEGIPVRCIEELYKLRKMVKKELNAIQCPALIIHSKKDESQHYKGAIKIFDRIGSENKELLLLEKSLHIAPLGPERELMFQKISGFFKDQ